MGLKLLTVTLVVLLSLQGIVEAKYISQHKEEVIIEDVGKIVEEIKGSVSKLIVESIATVKKTSDQVSVIGQQELNKSMKQIQQIKEEALAEIKHFETLAEKLGYDVSSCIQEQLPRLEALAQQAQEGVSVCLADMIAQFTKMYEDLLDAANNAYDNIFALVQKYDECQDWECRGETAQELVQEMMRTSSEVRIIVDRALRQMQQQIPATVECMQGEIATLKAELAPIVADIKACIAASAKTQMSTKNIEEDIAKLIAQVKQALKDLIEGGVAALKEARDAIVEFAQKLLADTLAKIQELAAKLHDDIEAIREEAAQLGIDIQECIDKILPRLQELILETQTGVKGCVETTLGSVSEIYEKVVALVEEVEGEVVTLIETIKGCENVECYVETAKNFAQVLKRIAGEVNELVSSSTEEIKEAMGELVTCIEPINTNYINGLNELSAEVRQCLKE